MATRANVRVEQGNKVQIFYHHWDGKPQVLCRCLEKMLRGKDTWVFEEICAELSSGTVDPNCPFEPCNSPHGEIEFDYTISCDKRTLSYFRPIEKDGDYII